MPPGPALGLLLLLAAWAPNLAAAADEHAPEDVETVEVIATTPLHGVGLPKDRVPAYVQTATGADLERLQSLDLSDFMNRGLGSVSVNAAQNNPLQPDLQFRGFTASPVLGIAQGLAVYQDGVRVNEPFGDTVSWDLIPESAVVSTPSHRRTFSSRRQVGPPGTRVSSPT